MFLSLLPETPPGGVILVLNWLLQMQDSLVVYDNHVFLLAVRPVLALVVYLLNLTVGQDKIQCCKSIWIRIDSGSSETH